VPLVAGSYWPRPHLVRFFLLWERKNLFNPSSMQGLTVRQLVTVPPPSSCRSVHLAELRTRFEEKSLGVLSLIAVSCDPLIEAPPGHPLTIRKSRLSEFEHASYPPQPRPLAIFENVPPPSRTDPDMISSEDFDSNLSLVSCILRSPTFFLRLSSDPTRPAIYIFSSVRGTAARSYSPLLCPARILSFRPVDRNIE